ncbi:MAG: KinB-signaling pathway activation protein [Paenibacillaceae bacterium]
MTIRNWVIMFWSTLLIGAATAVGIGLMLAALDGELFQWNVMEFGYNVLSMILAGFMFSILSQMFFFAYMTLNYIARDMFRRPSTWKLVQIFFIITVPFEIYMFLWKDSPLKFALGLGVMILLSIGTAYWKVKMTNPNAFIPSVFFMLVFTLVETAIAIQVSNDEATLLMASALIACNAWQLLRLHRVLKKTES